LNYGQTNQAIYLQDLIIDTGNAARNLGTKILIALAHKKISQIKNSNITNILHKRHLHLIKQIRRQLIKIISSNKADEGRTVVIIDSDVYQQKVDTSVQDNHCTSNEKDPTDVYQKQIQQQCTMYPDMRYTVCFSWTRSHWLLHCQRCS
jgi:hypothetical protein